MQKQCKPWWAVRGGQTTVKATRVCCCSPQCLPTDLHMLWSHPKLGSSLPRSLSKRRLQVLRKPLENSTPMCSGCTSPARCCWAWRQWRSKPWPIVCLIYLSSPAAPAAVAFHRAMAPLPLLSFSSWVAQFGTHLAFNLLYARSFAKRLCVTSMSLCMTLTGILQELGHKGNMH